MQGVKFWIIIVCSMTVNVGSSVQSTQTQNILSCTRDVTNRTLIFSCPFDIIIESFDIDGIENLNTIEKLKVIGMGGRGPLTTIPKNICHLKHLKHLDLSYNQIKNAVFEFSSSCLSELETLDLSDNYLRKIPTNWISQMPILKSINLSKNKLKCIPNTMFYNISNIDTLDISSNKLMTFELWLIQIKDVVNCSNNRITRFSNDYNVDLSNYQSNITRQIIFENTRTEIDFDDSIFEMYNRCGEITSTNTKILMQAIGIIHNNNSGLLNWRCSCEQYYLQEYIVLMTQGNVFYNWTCNSDKIYREICSNQSSFNVTNIKPRLCKINPSEPGDIPQYMKAESCDSAADLETISSNMYNNLIKIDILNEATADEFADIIDESNDEIQSIISPTNSESIENNFQNAISHIEHLIESINTPINISSYNSISILSLFKNSRIYSYSQINQTNSFLSYSTEINLENSLATITIDQISIQNLSETDIYTFYYLPSSIFQFAQEDQNIIIIPPIIGIYLPGNSPRLINMSFTDSERQFGRYSCVFWHLNQWNDSGCSYSRDSKLNRHLCFCNHTTSFALIFIPNKTLSTTSIPSITVAFISIICFCISIILSIYRQATIYRHLSITNIFTLINSIIFFLLLTIILIRGYQSNLKNNDKCSRSEQNLVITTYFFLITTFASKTLLGICYFLTIFFHFTVIQFTSISNKWYYISFFLVIIIALIPTIIINIMLKQWTNLFLQYQGICWFNTSIIFQFISIPIISFIGLNLLIIFGITIRLCQFSIRRETVKTNEKRMIISIMIWLALCVSLGIAWIFGPFLDVLIKETDETSSAVKLWFFGILIGLEGLWVLIVNVVFYFNQKVNKKNRQKFLNTYNK